MVHHSSCPVCSSYDLRLRLICTDHFKSGENFPLYTCSVCGFTFTQDHPEENAMGAYYESDDYISHSDTSEGLVNKIYKVVRSRMLLKKRDIVMKMTGLEKGNLLDIGSGTGHFIAGMKNAGWRVKGIEINEKTRLNSSEKFGLEIIPPDQISSLETGSFDCITLWHVLEHFSDLNLYVAEIHRLLKPSGTCIIAVPNIDSYDSRHYGQYWAAFDVPRHLWHFNPDTFGFLFEGRGFRIINIKTLPLDVFYISILSERYKRNKMAFFTGILKGSYFALRALLNKRKCSSLIYILKK
jgi:2-polyprenyl-3-methyl-5-hydroxy-6-metoxy-1,4-benzoquinol methylase